MGNERLAHAGNDGGDVYDVLDAKTPVRHKELGEFPKKRYVFFIGERVRLVDESEVE